ncbi:MAG: AAA family ATPase [Oleiphilaceae bacterium]|nr:AAA family ATPase [Oleiphilaceae bacterium]
MYETHFGLREAPFALTPNTRYFLRSSTHWEALRLLLVALRQGEGFVKISGEVGTGKTLLCRMLLNGLPNKVVTAYLPNPRLSPEGLYSALADELALSLPEPGNTHRTLALLNAHLMELAGQEKRVVMVIDEAQAMPEETMEALRLLSNLETENRKLLQVVLFGQPELDEMLGRPSLRQLKQRIGFQYRLRTLDHRGVADYVRHRLHQAGYNGGQLFSPGAIRLLARSANGTPRLINILAHKALIAAYGKGVPQVTKRHVRLAVKDTESARQGFWSRRTA